MIKICELFNQNVIIVLTIKIYLPKEENCVPAIKVELIFLAITLICKNPFVTHHIFCKFILMSVHKMAWSGNIGGHKRE